MRYLSAFAYVMTAIRRAILYYMTSSGKLKHNIIFKFSRKVHRGKRIIHGNDFEYKSIKLK